MASEAIGRGFESLRAHHLQRRMDDNKATVVSLLPLFIAGIVTCRLASWAFLLLLLPVLATTSNAQLPQSIMLCLTLSGLARVADAYLVKTVDEALAHHGLDDLDDSDTP